MNAARPLGAKLIPIAMGYVWGWHYGIAGKAATEMPFIGASLRPGCSTAHPTPC